MRKKTNKVIAYATALLMAVLIPFCNVENVFAEDVVGISTEGFTIEDSELLKALAKYDTNSDTILTLEEMSDVTELSLDNLPIKSLKGLEALELNSLSAINCELESLDGIRDMRNLVHLYLDGNNISELGDISEMWNLEKIDLKNNKLQDVEELGKLLEKDYIEKIEIEGNPLFNEALEYLFIEYYKPVSIIGAVGSSAFQKLSIYPLSVDLDRMVLTYDGLIDVNVPDFEFFIDDTSVAAIGESYKIERYRPFEASFPDSSYVLKVNLVKEGKTRMKITCGELERYTDIIVLPEGSLGELKIELDSISDENLVYALDDVSKTYSGIISKKNISKVTSLSIDSSEATVTSFESLTDFSSLSSLNLNAYTKEQLELCTGLNDSLNITELVLTNGTFDKLQLKNKIPSLRKLIVASNEIECVDVAETFENLEYLDLSYNKISSAENIIMPAAVKELYLEGNPLSKEEIEKVFANYMFNDDIYGEVDTYVPFKLNVDIIPDKELKYEIANEDICERKGKELRLIGEGITVMKVSFGSESKYVTVVSGDYNEFLPGDVNGDKIQNATDALEILKYSAKISVSTELINEIADINEDVKINAQDALEVLKIAAKITE